MIKKILLFFYVSSHLYAGNLCSLYFTPNQKVDKIILETVQQAEHSVYLAGYSFNWKNLACLLKDLKDLKKVDVRIFVEKPPSKAVMAGLEENIKVDNNKSSLFHPKFIIIDNKLLLVGSLNFIEESMYSDHNNLLVFKNPDFLKFFKDKFLSLWEGKTSYEFYKGENVKVYFSPENNCEEKIQDCISSSIRSIHFAHFDFTSEEIAESIARRKLAGVNVFGIIERSKIFPYSIFHFLRDFGCEIRKSNMAGLLHDKFFIIDGETVITGSYNPTHSARKNTECLMIIKDKELAEAFLKEWKSLWRWHSLK